MQLNDDAKFARNVLRLNFPLQKIGENTIKRKNLQRTRTIIKSNLPIQNVQGGQLTKM